MFSSRKKVLVCPMCDAEEPVMYPKEIARFNAALRLLGWLLSVPAIVILILTGIFLAGIFSAGFQGGDIEAVVMAGGMSVALAVPVGLMALLVLGFGLLLTSTRSVYRCEECGYIVERD